MVKYTMQLNIRQARFVDEYLVDFNGAQAAIRAGYSANCAKEQAYDLLTRPHVKAAVRRRQDETALRLQITRDDLLRGLLGAIEMAREQGDAAAMIRGAAEINKMLGFYRPRTGDRVSGDEVDGDMLVRIEAMTDEELLNLIYQE